MVTDYYDHAEVVCSEGDLRKAIAASAAIPAVFRPVMLDGIIMIDGGIFNPVPFDQLAGWQTSSSVPSMWSACRRACPASRQRPST
jgi:predicted acylesterase/phospholipase RssA